MALIGEPKFVILDDPFSGLDPIIKFKLTKTIYKYTRNSALLLATEDCNLAELICDQIAIMHQGQFVVTGSPNEIIEIYGRGYSVDIHINMKIIEEQCSAAARSFRSNQSSSSSSRGNSASQFLTSTSSAK